LFAALLVPYPFGLLFSVLLPIVFWLLSPQLARGIATIRVRGAIALATATILSLVATAYGFRYGLQYEGAAYAWTVLAINIMTPLLLSCLLWINRRTPRYAVCFAYHWLLCAWIGSYAFAYLGELP
jgi:hypothetical protein